MNNVGSAILIIGLIYFHFVYGLNQTIVISLSLIALITWVYPGFTKEREKLLKAQIRYYEAKANFYEKKEE